MNTTPRHPLADEYLAELHRSAQRLPEPERRELIDELTAHVDAGTAGDRSEADIRNLLDALGDPDEVVDAAAPPAPLPSRRGQSPTTALVVAVVALVVMVLFPLLAIPLGLGAIILAVSARRAARRSGEPKGVATAALVLGVVALVLPLAFMAAMVTSESDPEGPNTEPATEAVPTSTVGG